MISVRITLRFVASNFSQERVLTELGKEAVGNAQGLAARVKTQRRGRVDTETETGVVQRDSVIDIETRLYPGLALHRRDGSCSC